MINKNKRMAGKVSVTRDQVKGVVMDDKKMRKVAKKGQKKMAKK